MRPFRGADDAGRRPISLRAPGERLSQRMQALVSNVNKA